MTHEGKGTQNETHTCPWWLLFTFDNPLRRRFHDPLKILAPYVGSGDTVLDVGCGMGVFTLGLAELVGPDGRVIAADLQPQMLAGLRQRAERAGLMQRIKVQQSTRDQIGVDQALDFALAFWMVHEVRRPQPFLQEIYKWLRPGAKLLISEPRIHVSEKAFHKTVSLAQTVGFFVAGRPRLRFSRAVLLTK